MDKDSISITWHVFDVIERAKERGLKVNKAQARNILQNVERHHDCNIGVTWETLDYHTDNELKGGGR